jgi:outer membrane receptor protein involved in Fe transport
MPEPIHILFLLLAATPAPEAPAPETPEEEIVVTARPEQTASSDQTIRDADLEYFPRRTASDLMRLVPGLHITQHTGGAKAHQIFLRGFDAEHGSDIAASLDGIPLNEVSHVHGQGYLDLHFLIPEVVDRVHVQKGPYDGESGNFATAGTVQFDTDPGDASRAACHLGLGSFNTRTLLADVTLASATSSLRTAVQGEQTDGFTSPGRLEAYRAFGHARARLAQAQLDVVYAGYRARSQASDTLPVNLIQSGGISRFSSLDDSNRVDVDRHLAGLSLRGRLGDNRYRLVAYYNFKDTRIFSNFTYFYFHPAHGDQLEQSDHRHYGGIDGRIRFVSEPGGVGLASELGMQVRLDRVAQTQANTQRRIRFNLVNQYGFDEVNLGVFANQKLLLGERWMFLGTLRYDLNLVDISGLQDVRQLDIYTNRVEVKDDVPRQGFLSAHALSPSLSAVYRASDNWRLFLNIGRGFVTRPARDQANRHESWAPAVNSAELGSRVAAWGDMLNLAGSLWWMGRQSEWVFDSEFGGTVSRGQSHRAGAELELRLRPLDWMYLACDVFFIHARLDTGQGWAPVPNAPAWMATQVIAVDHPAGVHATVRGRFLGPRRHDLGRESPASYVIDLVLAYEAENFVLGLEVDNLLDVDWYDSVFAYPVRPAPGAPVDTGLQVTPGMPLAARLTLTVRL